MTIWLAIAKSNFAQDRHRKRGDWACLSEIPRWPMPSVEPRRSDAVRADHRSARGKPVFRGIFDDGFKDVLRCGLDRVEAAMCGRLRAAPAFWRRSAPPHVCRLFGRCGAS